VALSWEAVERLGRFFLELLERGPRDGIGDAEPPLVLTDGFEQHQIGREVAAVGDLAEDLRVFQIVEVVTVGIKDAVTSQAERLMHLEIKTDRCHGPPLYARTGDGLRLNGELNGPIIRQRMKAQG